MNSGGVVAPYCSTLSRVLAFYASTVLLAVVLAVIFLFIVKPLVVLMILPFRHTAAAPQAAAEQQTANTTRGGRWCKQRHICTSYDDVGMPYNTPHGHILLIQ